MNGEVKVDRQPTVDEVGWRARAAAMWRLRCPRCLQGPVFRTNRWRETRMHYACPQCRVIFGRENGYFTGAMIVSYMLAVPLAAVLYGMVWLIAGLGLGLSLEWLFMTTLLYFLPFTPAVFRFSRVIWMHFDRLVDTDPENERFASPAQTKRAVPHA